jgi:hypothetical protein
LIFIEITIDLISDWNIKKLGSLRITFIVYIVIVLIYFDLYNRIKSTFFFVIRPSLKYSMGLWVFILFLPLAFNFSCANNSVKCFKIFLLLHSFAFFNT